MYAPLLRRARARPGFGGAGRRAARPRRGGAWSARPRMCSCSPSTIQCARTDTSGAGRPTRRGPGCRGREAASCAGKPDSSRPGDRRQKRLPGRGCGTFAARRRSADAADRSLYRASVDTGRHRMFPSGTPRRPCPAAGRRLAAVHPIAPAEDVPRPLERATKPDQRLFDGAERHNWEKAAN